jgi:sugar lactone lactonase YvrE
MAFGFLRLARFFGLIFVMLFFSIDVVAEAWNLKWAKILSTPDEGFSGDVETDREGNVIVASGSRTLLTKLDSGGNILWQLRNPSTESGGGGVGTSAVATYGTDLYFIFGINGGVSIGSFSTNGFGSILGKLNGDGNLVWSVFIPSLYFGRIAASDAGVFFGGMFRDRVDFGSFAFQSTFGDVLVGKMDLDGKVVWFRQGVGVSDDYLDSIALTPTGEVAISGTFISPSFGIGGMVVRGPTGNPPPKAIFSALLNANGLGLWALSAHSAVDLGNFITISSGIASKSDGSTIWSGDFTGNLTVGTNNLFSVGGKDIFVACLRTDGSPEWTSAFGGNGDQFASDVLSGPDGSVFIAGTFFDDLKFGTTNLESFGSSDVLLANLSSTGETMWVKRIGFSGKDDSARIAMTPAGELILSCTVQGGVLVDGTFIEGNGLGNIFVAAFTNSAPVPPRISVQPVGLVSSPGGSATFTVVLLEDEGANYQWRFNGILIPNATNATLIVPSVTLENEGTYFVEVSTSAVTVRSAAAQLVIRGQLEVRVTTVAGTNTAGLVDSTNGREVRFYRPNGLEYLTAGIVAVADGHNHVIRFLDGSGSSATFAGKDEPGFVNGSASVARFNYPLGLNVDKSLDVLVADSQNNVIRRIGMWGLRNVSTVAGSGRRGYKDGAAAEAEFNFPNDLVVDASGNIFVTEFTNHVVRKISVDGEVTTFAGSGQPGFRDGVGTNALMNMPAGIEIDAQQNLYVTEWRNHCVRKISPQGVVTTLAGTNVAGFVDGQGSAARFDTPDGITIDALGNLYVVEHLNHAVRKVDANGNVLTVAGLGTSGFADGDRRAAMFNAPAAIMWHPDGSLWVSDTENHAIRRIEFLSATNSAEVELWITLNPALTVFGQPGVSYRIEAAETSSAGMPMDWTVLDTVRLTSEAEQWFDPQPATRAKRWYRAVRVE